MTDQAMNHQSEDSKVEGYASQETVPAEVDTRIDFLTQRFFFHEMIKDGEFSRHYIVEDIEVDPATLNDPEAPLFYYLKQLRFKDKAEFLFAKKFYMKIFNYCKMPFAKNDIVNLNYIFDFDNDNEYYYELVLVYDYGESDRIDVENISTAHINKFLKNVCLLLNDLKKFDGFKARYINNLAMKSWKNELAREYGVHRLDLYLIGLLWLVFLNVQVDSYIAKEYTLAEVRHNIKRLMIELPEDKRMEIVFKLVDLDNQPQLTLDDIILDFDEYYILENIKIEEDSRNRHTIDNGMDGNNGFYNYDSQDTHSYSEQQRELRKSPSKETNPFMRPYRESERDHNNHRRDEENTAQLYDSREPGHMIKIDGVDFTLRDENSVNFNRQQTDDIITIKDVNRSLPHDADGIYDLNYDHDTENRKTTDPSYNRADRNLNAHNRHNSEKQLLRSSEEAQGSKKPSMRKLKSNAVLNFNEKSNDLNPKGSINDGLKLSNIQQETEEGSEDEKIDRVYSYKNFVESKTSSHQIQKESITHKSSGIVENRYNTEEPSENEDRFNSFEVEDQPIDLLESIEQYDRVGLKGEHRNPSMASSKKSKKNSIKDDNGSRKPSYKGVRDSKDISSGASSRRRSKPSRKSKFNNDDGVVIDSNHSNSNVSNDDIKLEHPRDSQMKHKYDISSDSDKPVKVSGASKGWVKLSKKQFAIDMKQKNNNNENEENFSEEPRISTKFKRSSVQKVNNHNEEIENPRTFNVQSKTEGVLKIESKIAKDYMKLSCDDDYFQKNLSHKINLIDSKTDDKNKNQKSGVKKSDERSKSRNKQLVKQSSRNQESRQNSKRMEKSYERLRVHKDNEDRPKNEWDQEIEREEESRRRAKEIEEAVKRETERRRQEEEDKRRKEREALLLKETERIKKEQELKSKIEKKLKARLEEKEKQKKEETKKTKEEKKAIDEVNAKKEANEFEKIERREYNRDKSSEKINIISHKDRSPELSRQQISFKKLAGSKDKKDEKLTLETLDKKMKKAVQLSSVIDRKNLFLYNDDLSNKNISFKKVLTNLKEFEKIAQNKPTKEQATVENTQIVEIVDNDSAYDNLPGFNTYQKNLENEQTIHNNSNDKIVQSKINFSVKTNYVEDIESIVKEQKSDILLDHINNNNTNKFVKSNMDLSIKTVPPKKQDKVDKLLDDNELKKVEEIKNIKSKKSVDRSYLEIAYEKSLGNDYNYYKSDKNSISQDVRKSDINKKFQPPVKPKTDIAISIEEARKDEVDSDMDDEEFEEKVEEIQTYIEKGQYDDSLHLLTDLLKKVGGLKKVDVYKTIAMVYFKLKDFKQSITNLKRCINFIDENPDLPDPNEIKRSVFISLVVSLLETKRYQEAVDYLESHLFINKSDTPFSYFTLLGDAYRELGRYDDAHNAYEEQLKRFMTKELDSKTIKSLFLLVNKMILTLNSINDEVRLIKFYRQILGYADSLIKVDSTFKNSAQEYTIIKEHLLLAILNMLLLKENYNLTNYILNDVIRDKLVDYGKLDDDDKLRFCDTYLNFAMHLKNLPNYGGQKDCYVRYLRQALSIVKKCELTEENVKKELVITFNEGLYYLNQKEYQKAKEAFDESLRLYNSRYVEPDSELFAILYNIGLSLYSMNKYEDCTFYFEKIIDLNCPEDYIRSKTIKILSKVYQRLGEYQKCYDVMREWIYTNIASKDKEAKNFYIYLGIYYICCGRIRSSDFENILAQMKKNFDDQPETENIHYFNIFFNLTNLSFRNKNYKQNEEMVNKINNLLKQKNKNTFGTEYISLMCKLYTKYVLNKNENVVSEDEFLLTLCAPEFPVEDNSHQITTFLLNFMFILMNKLPTDPHKEPNKQFRNQLIDDIRQLKQSAILFDHITETLTSIIEKAKVASIKDVEKPIIEVKDQKPDTFVLQDSEKELEFVPRSKTPVKAKASPNLKTDNKNKPNKSPKIDMRKEQKELYDEIMQKEVKETEIQEPVNRPSISLKRLKRVNSEEFDQKWNLKKRTKCMCFEPSRKKADIIALIEEFLRQIKNMLFLNVTEKIPEYYTKFEEIIKEKRLNWEKYIYIKKLFSFYLKNRFNALDTKKFSVLLEALITEQPLCIHDFKMMLVFLESFKDSSYIEAFVIHMDKYHPHMSTIIFKQLFLDNFEDKYANIKADLFKRIHTGKFNIIENYPFIHYLNENNNLIIEKEFTFKVYQRLMYTVLNDKAYFLIFNKYIETKLLANFYLRYNVYSALVETIRKDNDGFRVVSTYHSILAELLKSQKILLSDCEFFMYDNLLLITLLRFNRPDNKEIGDKAIETLALLESNIADVDMYHFSLVSSLIGNILFKHKLYEHSIRAKSMAFDAMRKIKGDEVIFPVFYKEVDPKTLVFNILSYMFMNNLVLSRKEAVDQFYKKISNFEVNNKKDKIEQACFAVLYSIHHKDFTTAKQRITEVHNFLVESKLSSIHTDMFVATVDRLALDISMITGKPEEIQRQREKSRGSINKLYNNLVAEA